MNEEDILKIEFLEWFPVELPLGEVLEGLEKRGGVSPRLFQVLLERSCEQQPGDFVRFVERAILLRNQGLRRNKMESVAVAEALALDCFVGYLELNIEEPDIQFFYLRQARRVMSAKLAEEAGGVSELRRILKGRESQE